MTNFLAICLLIIPWVFIPINGVTNQFRLPQGIFLQFIMIGTIIIGLTKGITFKNKYFAILTGYLLLHIFFSFILPFGYEVMGQRNINVQIIPFLPYILLGILFIISLSIDYLKIAKTLCLSACLVSLFSLLQFIGLDPLKSIATYVCDNQISACLDNPNLVGSYLAIISPLFFIFKKKYLIGYGIVLLGILATKSHLAIGCALLASLSYLIIKFRDNQKLVLGIILTSIVLIIYLLYHDFLKLGNNMSNRFEVWIYAFNNFKHNTLFGLGLGKFQSLQFRYVNSIWNEVHNDWLQYTMELGLIGLGCFIALLIDTFRKVKITNLCYTLSFCIFLITMFFSFPIEVPSLAILGLISFSSLIKE